MYTNLSVLIEITYLYIGTLRSSNDIIFTFKGNV